MSMNESVERKLDEILERYHLLSWKEAGLKELIKSAQKEKEYWEVTNATHLINDLTKIIQIAENLTKIKEDA